MLKFSIKKILIGYCLLVGVLFAEPEAKEVHAEEESVNTPSDTPLNFKQKMQGLAKSPRTATVVDIAAFSALVMHNYPNSIKFFTILNIVWSVLSNYLYSQKFTNTSFSKFLERHPKLTKLPKNLIFNFLKIFIDSEILHNNCIDTDDLLMNQGIHNLSLIRNLAQRQGKPLDKEFLANMIVGNFLPIAIVQKMIKLPKDREAFNKRRIFCIVENLIENISFESGKKGLQINRAATAQGVVDCVINLSGAQLTKTDSKKFVAIICATFLNEVNDFVFKKFDIFGAKSKTRTKEPEENPVKKESNNSTVERENLLDNT